MQQDAFQNNPNRTRFCTEQSGISHLIQLTFLIICTHLWA